MGVGTDFDLVLGSKLIWFKYVDRNWFHFCAGMGIDLVFVWGSKMTCFFCVWIEIDLVYVRD